MNSSAWSGCISPAVHELTKISIDKLALSTVSKPQIAIYRPIKVYDWFSVTEAQVIIQISCVVVSMDDKLIATSLRRLVTLKKYVIWMLKLLQGRVSF